MAAVDDDGTAIAVSSIRIVNLATIFSTDMQDRWSTGGGKLDNAGILDMYYHHHIVLNLVPDTFICVLLYFLKNTQTTAVLEYQRGR